MLQYHIPMNHEVEIRKVKTAVLLVNKHISLQLNLLSSGNVKVYTHCEMNHYAGNSNYKCGLLLLLSLNTNSNWWKIGHWL